MKRSFIFILMLAFAFAKGFSQLKIDTSFSPAMLVDSFLLGEGVRVSNVSISGHRNAMAIYSVDSNAIGIRHGILLSTGLSTDAAGPNETPGKSGIISRRKNGDKDLNKVAKGRTFDVLVIEFDFIPLHNKLSFSYSFGSEEYTEYVGSSFNDVFAFFISGNEYRKKNIALLPDKKTPVTINNVNHKKNKQYFINNDYFQNTGLSKPSAKLKVSRWKLFWALLFHRQSAAPGAEIVFYTKKGAKKNLDQYIVEHFEYDGFTKLLKVDCKVTPYKKYRLKIAIGDVGDGVFDSGVFLEKGSFSSRKDTMVAGFIPYPDRSMSFNFDSAFGKINPPVYHIEAPATETDDEFLQAPVIYFEVASSLIPDSAHRALEETAAFLKKNPGYRLEITGYTDNTGDYQKNEKLSESRATAVVDLLVQLGVERSRLVYMGKSSDDPVADNATENGKALNRRVELEFVLNEIK